MKTSCKSNSIVSQHLKGLRELSNPDSLCKTERYPLQIRGQCFAEEFPACRSVRP